MLDALRFVQGAVAKKDFVPALTHFRVDRGTIRGYNGMLGLCCPIDLDLNVSPRAVPFIKAIQTCQDTIQLHVTPAGKLSVKSGKFKALVDCIQEDFPEVEPEGTSIELNGGLLAALKLLAPMIADDASRPWARGILFRGQSAFATNNIIIAEYWLGYHFPVEINIPRAAVVELLRIKEEPISMQIAENSATFHFSGNRWLRTQTHTTQWPDISRILDQPSNPIPVHEGLWEAVENVVPFVDEFGRVFLNANGITTGEADSSGASVDLPGLNASGVYHFEQLRLLDGVALSIDFNTSPKLWFGDKVRGAIAGMRH